MRCELTERLSAIVAPPACVICKTRTEPAERICTDCTREMQSLPRGASGPGFAAAFPYAGAVRTVIAALKFGGAVALARDMSELMARRIPGELLSGATIIPVPAHPIRRRARGYNQSVLLAKELAAISGAGYLDCLVRRASGRPQSELGRVDRQQMRADSVAVDERAIRRAARDALVQFPTNVVLCDDVRTTGVTLEVCAQAIRERQPEPGSGQIQAVVFASARANGTTDRIVRRQSRRPTG